MFSPHNPRNFLLLATRLLKDASYSPLETRVRTSIGRAYYAAFLLSKAKQETRGHSFPDDHTVHNCVIDSLQDDRLSNIASKLDELKDFRSDADYHMNVSLSNIDGDKCLRLAKDILTLLDSV
jgi:uncharacterized protein (UPF0332 family)